MSKGLLRVEKMNENGHAVVFAGDMFVVVKKATDEVNHLGRQDGNFMLDLWIFALDVAEKWKVLAGSHSPEEFGDQGHNTAEDFSGFQH